MNSCHDPQKQGIAKALVVGIAVRWIQCFQASATTLGLYLANLSKLELASESLGCFSLLVVAFITASTI